MISENLIFIEEGIASDKMNTRSKTKASILKLNDIPMDIIINIVNKLSVQDAKNLEIVLQTKKIPKHLMSTEYIYTLIKSPKIVALWTNLLIKPTHLFRKLNEFNSSHIQKVIRYNSENGTAYGLYSEMVYNFQGYAFHLKDISIPEFPNIKFGHSFQRFPNQYEMYYNVFDILLIVKDDHDTKCRKIFIRFPYQRNEYAYIFAILLLRAICGMIFVKPMFTDWTVRGYYMIYELDTKTTNNGTNRPLLKPVPYMENDFNHNFFINMLYKYVLYDRPTVIIDEWQETNTCFPKQACTLIYPNLSLVTNKFINNLGIDENDIAMRDIYIQFTE